MSTAVEGTGPRMKFDVPADAPDVSYIRGLGISREDAIRSTHEPAPMDRAMMPHRNKVLVLMCQADTQKGSIIIPGQAQVKTGEAVVIAVGSGDWNSDRQAFDPIKDLYVGQRVMMAKYMGSQCVLKEEYVDEDGEKRTVERTYVTLHPDHILNVYE